MRNDDPCGHEMLVAAILQTAVQDVCRSMTYRSGGSGDAARAELARDVVCGAWANAIGVAWPPDPRILQAIIDALRRGEVVWARYERNMPR